MSEERKIITKIQEIVDDSKESLIDNDWIKICDYLKKKFRQY